MNNIIGAIGAEYFLKEASKPDSQLLNFMLVDDELPSYTLIKESSAIPAHSGGSSSVVRSPNHPEYEKILEHIDNQVHPIGSSPNHPEYAKIFEEFESKKHPTRSPNHPEYAKIFDKLD